MNDDEAIALALAEAEKELGVPIPDEAITQMKAHLDDIGRSLQNLGIIAWRRGRYGEALSHLDQALELGHGVDDRGVVFPAEGAPDVAQ